MKTFSPDLAHEEIFEGLKPEMAFDENLDYDSWRAALGKKLTELLGEMPNKVPLDIQIEWEKDGGEYIEKRFSFCAESLTRVPCHLLIPKNAKKPCPVVICLQGHSTGMHISLGRTKYEGDRIINDRDTAIQAVGEGYAALTIEQRALGERKSEKVDRSITCAHPSMVALLIGRTLLGERVWDVSRSIDAMEEFDEIDTGKVGCMGGSGGGTATFYAACMDERIKIAMPACSVCTFRDSIVPIHHCTCNYIPSIAKYADMGDLAALIAPRPLVAVAGREDEIFPVSGTLEAFETIRKIYKKAGYPDNCRLVIGEGGHRFYADPSWDIFRSLVNW